MKHLPDVLVKISKSRLAWRSLLEKNIILKRHTSKPYLKRILRAEVLYLSVTLHCSKSPAECYSSKHWYWSAVKRKQSLFVTHSSKKKKNNHRTIAKSDPQSRNKVFLKSGGKQWLGNNSKDRVRPVFPYWQHAVWFFCCFFKWSHLRLRQRFQH